MWAVRESTRVGVGGGVGGWGGVWKEMERVRGGERKGGRDGGRGVGVWGGGREERVERSSTVIRAIIELSREPIDQNRDVRAPRKHTHASTRNTIQTRTL